MGALRPLAALALGLAIFGASGEAHALPDAYNRSSAAGLGIVLGDPTGFTFKWRFAHESAVQLHFGFGVGGENDGGSASLVFDYLYHFMTAIPPIERAGWLAPYVGVGGKLNIHEAPDTVRAGVRVPFGLAFFTRGAPVEIFLEIAIGMHVAPSTSALIDAGLGARWYF